jgi:nitrite reductase/ring-hydroxylating ferredoxin subunit
MSHKYRAREDVRQPDAEGFFVAAPATAVQVDRITAVTIAGVPIILTRINGRVYAIGARCPHAAGDLSRGHVRRGQISCPDHGFRFDVRDGRAAWPADEVCRLKRYPVKEENGWLKVKL